MPAPPATSSPAAGRAGGDPTRGRVTLDLLDMEERSQGSFVTLEEARRRVRGIPGATINVERPVEGPPVGDPLSIELTGDDFARLGEIAELIQREISDIPGLATLDNDFDLARPEVIVRVDRDQAARLGLSTALIARTLRTAINGTEASQFREGEDEWDITVRFAPGARARKPRRPAAAGGGQRGRRADSARDGGRGHYRSGVAVDPAQGPPPRGDDRRQGDDPRAGAAGARRGREADAASCRTSCPPATPSASPARARTRRSRRRSCRRRSSTR